VSPEAEISNPKKGAESASRDADSLPKMWRADASHYAE